jgi:uncharacterized protein (TIGR02996 family)
VESDTERALVASLRADLEDWQRWLVYADWLTDRADPRGELITLEHRLAVSLGGGLEGLSPGERSALRERADALALVQERAWWASGALPEDAISELRYGFLVGVRLRWSDHTLADLARLLAHPDAGLLSRLDLERTGIGSAGAAALAGCELLRSLAELSLMYNDIDDEGAATLAASDNLRSLSVLSLAYTRIGDEGAAMLAASDNLRSLSVLDLTGNDISDEGAAALASAESLRGCEVQT